MVEFFKELVFWHWWILAVALVVLEIMAPGVIFLWLGIGAGLTGLVLFVQPDLAWETQLMIFGVLSVVAGIGGRMLVATRPLATDKPDLNRRGNQYIGRTFELDAPIVNGVGKVKVGDSNWRIVGDDAPSGTQVQVTGVEGASLRVEIVD
jgi:inner membrane protein